MKHSQTNYNGQPWNDKLVEDDTEWLLDNAPKWYRNCHNNTHEVDFDGELFICNTCDRQENFKK